MSQKILRRPLTIVTGQVFLETFWPVVSAALLRPLRRALLKKIDQLVAFAPVQEGWRGGKPPDMTFDSLDHVKISDDYDVL